MTSVAIKGNEDGPIKLIEISIAGADAAPLAGGAAGGECGDIFRYTNRSPKSGCWFIAMTHDSSTDPPSAYRRKTGGSLNMGPVHHLSKFGFCAYPAEYGPSNKWTYIINEKITMYQKDTRGLPVWLWPTKSELRRDWVKVGD